MTVNKCQELNDIEECVNSNRLYHSDKYHEISEVEQTRIQKDLLDWYHVEKRLTMPWRKDNDLSWDRQALGQRAYEVWVSEIMLQQTQVATVISFYNRWMEAFPTIHDLASADIERVNTLWAGLGYYSRAKRLWEGAQKVVNQLDGLLPNNAKDLQAEIPGVGRYTAGAVASIVFGQSTPVVDGNVIRVLARIRAIHADPKKAKTIDLFWDIAASLVPQSKPGDFNQALMELGARVCTPQNPDCSHCPIQKDCRAFKQLELVKSLSKNGFFAEKKKRKQIEIEHECSTCHALDTNLVEDDYTVTRYPLKVEKKAPRDEECAVSIVERISPNKEPLYLISKRPETGLLAGLWEFPTLELTSLESKYNERVKGSSEYLKMRYGLEFDTTPHRQDLGNVVHLFSHIRKVYHIEWIQYEHGKDLDDEKDVKWVTLEELKISPIPTGLKKALKLLEKFKTTTSTPLTKKTPVKKAPVKRTIKTEDTPTKRAAVKRVTRAQDIGVKKVSNTQTITSFFSVKKDAK